MYIFVMIVFIFCMGSIFGWLLEVLYRHFNDKEKKWFNPGFCVGPYLPIYGIGLLVAYIITHTENYINIEDIVLKRLLLFALMALCMTLVELIGGILLLKFFNLRLWDYSEEKFNYKGYICLKFSLYWMLISAIYYFIVHPQVQDSVEWLSKNIIFSFVVGAIIGVYIVDIVYSAQVVAKIKSFANESGIVVRLEDIKEKIRRNKMKREAKVAFFTFMLKENIENAISSFKDRKTINVEH